MYKKILTALFISFTMVQAINCCAAISAEEKEVGEEDHLNGSGAGPDSPGGSVGSNGPGLPDVSWNTCSKCNGPGCEELDQACKDVESESFGMICGVDVLGVKDNCFVTKDPERDNRLIVCCCKPGTCPGY